MAKKTINRPTGAVSAYVNTIQFHKNTPTIITKTGKEYRLIGGKRITQQAFLEKYPIPYLNEGRGFSANADRTKNFVANKKSY